MGQDYWPIFKLQENALNLPRGWSGLLLPGTRPKHPSRHLAIARLDGDVAEASLRLSFEEGAPVLSASSVVRGQSGTTHLKLEPFESFGETVTSYAEVLGDGAVEVRKMGLGRYLFRTISGSTAEVRMRFADGQAGPFEFHDRDAKILKPNALIGQDRSGGVVFKIEGVVMVLNMDEIKRGQKGPAVEIAEATSREDRRVTLRIEAHDQSGIRRIKVFVDGRRGNSKNLRGS